MTGTAVPGDDYLPSSGILTFTPKYDNGSSAHHTPRRQPV